MANKVGTHKAGKAGYFCVYAQKSSSDWNNPAMSHFKINRLVLNIPCRSRYVQNDSEWRRGSQELTSFQKATMMGGYIISILLEILIVKFIAL